jgi:uncharacterized protein (TIGR02186 family)
MKHRATPLLFAACIVATPAQAEKLIVTLSNHRVAITSNFTGADLVLFGTIEPDSPTAAMRTNYDIVVTVTGPARTMRARRKERVLGIWVNTDFREFVGVPTYLAVLSNRLLRQTAPPDTLRRMQLGIDNYVLAQQIGRDVADTVHEDPFRAAFVRLETEYGLYRESPTAVNFLTSTVFRASIPLPSQVPTGLYNVDVKLFSEGNLVGEAGSALQIIKAGFEEYVAEAARDYGLLYGLAMAMLALLTGWFASVVFRRD